MHVIWKFIAYVLALILAVNLTRLVENSFKGALVSLNYYYD